MFLQIANSVVNGFVALPENVQLGIQILIVSLVAVVIQWVIARASWLSFLAAYAKEWGLLVAGLVINALQNALPTGYEDVSIKGVVFLLALIGAFYKYLQARNVKGFAA